MQRSILKHYVRCSASVACTRSTLFNTLRNNNSAVRDIVERPTIENETLAIQTQADQNAVHHGDDALANLTSPRTTKTHNPWHCSTPFLPLLDDLPQSGRHTCRSQRSIIRERLTPRGRDSSCPSGSGPKQKKERDTPQTSRHTHHITWHLMAVEPGA